MNYQEIIAEINILKGLMAMPKIGIPKPLALRNILFNFLIEIFHIFILVNIHSFSLFSCSLFSLFRGKNKKDPILFY